MVLVAFALRALFAWTARGVHATPAPEDADIDALAWSLARGLGFTLGGGAGVHPTALHAPVMPFVTSLLYRFTGHDYFAALLLQCTAGALLPLALDGFARATWGSGVARIAGWLGAVHPLLVVACASLLPDSLFAVALVIALAASSEWVKTPRPGRALGTGLLWGVAALTCPGALPLALLVIAWGWFPLGLALASGDRLRQVALLLLGVALAVGPWTLRNAAELHAFVPVATGATGAPYERNNPPAWDEPAGRAGADRAGAAEPLDSRHRPLIGRRGPASTPIDPRRLWSVAVLPLALFGVFTMLVNPKRLFLALPLLTVAALIASALAYPGATRLRVPIEPLVALHAAVGADALWNRWRWRHRKLRLVPVRR